MYYSDPCLPNGETNGETIDEHTLRAIERIIGHTLPAYGSNTLLEDCRTSTPEFAAVLIAAAKAQESEER